VELERTHCIGEGISSGVRDVKTLVVNVVMEQRVLRILGEFEMLDHRSAYLQPSSSMAILSGLSNKD
jgi:hypothetical protein